MALKDATSTSGKGAGGYEPCSPFVARVNTIDYSVYGIGASGADNVNIMPMGLNEYVNAFVMKTNTAGNATATVKVTDTRTGVAGAGAVLAAAAADAAAGTVVAGAGAAIGIASGLAATTTGFLQLTTVAAVALTGGNHTFYAVIGKGL